MVGWRPGCPRTHSRLPHAERSAAAEPGTQEHYPWVVEQMRAGRMVVLASLEELPSEASVDRESARLAGIQSNLTVPLTVGGEPPVGALALSACGRSATGQTRW